MTVVLVVLLLVAVAAYEVRADRKVRRSTAGATPVVIVRGLKPRWWRRLLGKAVNVALLIALAIAALLLARHGAKPGTDPEHSWPMPSATPAPSHGLAPIRTRPAPSAGSKEGSR